MAVVVYQGTVVLGMLPGGNAKLPDISYSGVVRARVARPETAAKPCFGGNNNKRGQKIKAKQIREIFHQKKH